MKKLLTLAALLLALTACGSEEPSSEAAQQPAAEASQAPTSEAPQQLSTEDACAEMETYFTSLVESDPTDEQIAELASQLDDLATRASDPVQEPIETMAGLVAMGRSETRSKAADDPAFRDKYDDAATALAEECGL